MASNGPRDEVFTTVLLNQEGCVADWERHERRLQDHAQRLRITLPQTSPVNEALASSTDWRLVRIGVLASQNEWSIDIRNIAFRDEDIEAITVPAPRWNQRTNGCKHGAWAAYTDAHQAAEDAGCDAALMVHEHGIVDGDRATPMVLDEDGTVWLADASQGGVDGITASILTEHLPSLGLPVVRGKLNERMVARCAELILVGTGMGVCRVNTLDGEPVGTSTTLSERCRRLLEEHYSKADTWSTTGHDRVG